MSSGNVNEKSWFRRHAVWCLIIVIVLFCWLASINAPKTKKLDYSKSIYTAEGGIVCPQTLFFDPRADHDANAIFEVFTAFTNRDEKARALGCEVLKEGIPVYVHRMAEPFDTYLSLSLTPNQQGNLFTIAAELENESTDGASEDASNDTSSSLGNILVRKPSREPIPKGDVSVPSDGFGADICSDSEALAALDDAEVAWFASSSGPTASTSKSSAMESFEELSKSHGCNYLRPGTSLVSEGANPIGSLAIVTAQLPDGTTVRGVTFPTMITQSQQLAAASQGEPTPDSTSSSPPTGVSAPISNTPSGVPPIDITPSSTQDPMESKRLNTEGLHMLSGANPDFASARNDFERAFQLDSANVEALNNLGYVYGRLGDYQTAETTLLKVLDMSPTRKSAQGNLGAIEAGLGKTQEAADHFCQYIRQFDSLEHGKSNLTRVFKDADSNVQAAINMTLANCN